ncbi:hypothetical protein C1645_801672 [Glomus cerebriforme]|uniref:Uncharacterized protein n=1 Tax=Glomus cerebriforme TaxID=658196 RepID=A0A397TRM5_9GLOM|nr:hypothetical protein C1645_801672 [Glomus cerebriforme]
MAHYKLPPNYYLQFYSPPPHPQPLPTFHTTPQKFLRFHKFHHTHFIQNRNFFQNALNPTAPWWLWKVEGKENVGEEVIEGRDYQQQTEEYENYEYQGEQYEEEKAEEEPKVEFVLSEEAIAMFRFSELRRKQLAEEIAKTNKDSQSQSSSKSPTDNYLDTEPDPSLIPSFHNQPSMESKKLYGNSCTIINTLEAEVNSTFVQSFNVPNKTTNNEVVYWPVLPLRFV